ncbi:LysR family transcriptional regulator, partial [Shewanella algae]|uniref:LysR family transcriptional regulator n=1 Tax=Shewanella algae TaxID=38313 RepID=UPI003190367C
LRIFVAVAEREHVTEAAKSLGLTQSAARAAINALENCYQSKLFNRVGRRVELNETGKAFLVEAKAILARVSSAELMLSE